MDDKMLAEAWEAGKQAGLQQANDEWAQRRTGIRIATNPYRTTIRIVAGGCFQELTPRDPDGRRI